MLYDRWFLCRVKGNEHEKNCSGLITGSVAYGWIEATIFPILVVYISFGENVSTRNAFIIKKKKKYPKHGLLLIAKYFSLIPKFLGDKNDWN